MKVDYDKFPEIPPGCQLNENKKQGVFQVFREGKHRSPGCTKKRESIGTIRKGVFTPSKQWLLTQKLAALEADQAAKETSEEKADKAAAKAMTAEPTAPAEVLPTAESDANDASAETDLCAPSEADAVTQTKTEAEAEAEAALAESERAAEDDMPEDVVAQVVAEVASAFTEEAVIVSTETPSGEPPAEPPAETSTEPTAEPLSKQINIADADEVLATETPADMPVLIADLLKDDQPEEAATELTRSPGALLTALYLQALTGSDGTMEEFVRRRGSMVREVLPQLTSELLTEKHVADVLRFTDPAQFEKTALRLVRPVLRCAFEGVAADEPYALRDTADGPASLVIHLGGSGCDPALIDGLNLSGCVCTTGSGRIARSLLETLLVKGAGYLIPVTGSQAVKATSQLFNRSRPLPVSRTDADNHGDSRKGGTTVALLQGRAVSAAFRERWPGLETGTVIRVRTETLPAGLGRSTVEEAFYVTTLPLRDDLTGLTADLIAAARDADTLVMHPLFCEPRLIGAEPTVTASRTALRRSASAMLEENRLVQLGSGAADSMLALRAQPLRCFDVKDAVECLSRALGLC